MVAFCYLSRAIKPLYNRLMDHESVSAYKKEIFDLKTISFDEVPGQSRLFLDFQAGNKDLSKFFPNGNIATARFAKEVLANYCISRDTICDILLEENISYQVKEKTLKNIDKLRSEDCVAVLTGQQAGLFSGPIYTIYKALSAIKLADRLNAEGVNAVPVFWVASEDHDFDEIKKTTIVDRDSKIRQVEYDSANVGVNIPVGWIKTDETIREIRHDFFESLPETEFSSYLQRIIEETYISNESFSVAFTRLLAELFGDFGLIFTSPLNEELRKLSSPMFIQAIQKSKEIGSELLKRNLELEKHNYHSQVLVENDFFPFFYIDDDNKRNGLQMDLDGSKIRSQDAKLEFTGRDLVEIADKTPWKLSPNALMRPIVQDYLFPTVCYFGGGAEIAYFGQNSIIYRILDRPVTPIRHRASFTIIAAKHRKTFERYNLEFGDLYNGKEKVLSRIIENYINSPTSRVFGETEEVITSQIEKLDRSLTKDDVTLSESLSKRRRKILWHIRTLRRKFHRAELEKNRVVDRRIERMFSSVLPAGVLQERNLNALQFLNLYGENFIYWLYDAIDLEEKEHQIITF